jgi:type III restriction enzyme
MSNPVFDAPILNSPYEKPGRHWELDDEGQPTHRVVESRRGAKYITPIRRPRKRKGGQASLALDEGAGLTTETQAYDLRGLINDLRIRVDQALIDDLLREKH